MSSCQRGPIADCVPLRTKTCVKIFEISKHFTEIFSYSWEKTSEKNKKNKFKTILQKDIPAGHKHPIFNCNKSSQKNFWKMTVHLPLPVPKAIVRKKVRVVVVFVAVGLFVCFFYY